MTSQAPLFASSRVAPSRTSFSFTSVALDQATRDGVLSKSAIAFVPRPEDQHLHHYSNQLRLQLQWRPAAKLQLLMFRNTLGCVAVAVFVNGCFYSGNIFSFKSSAQQSRREFLMALMIWTALLHTVKMTIAHLPYLTTQRFLAFPDMKPSLWFCIKKLVKGLPRYFMITLAGMIGVGLLVQNTSLMCEHFEYKLHFYLANLFSIVYTAAITAAVKRIYYEETYQGRNRRKAASDQSESQQTALSPTSSPQKAHKHTKYRTPNFWREYVAQLPNLLLICFCGGFVHVVSWYRVLDRGTIVILGFTAFGVVIKLLLQEAAKHYILKKHIRGIRTMCVVVGIPTVLIDTQARIVLLGTQTSTFMVAGTFVMAIGEIGFRALKAAYVARTIRRQASALELRLQELSANSDLPEDRAPTPSSLKLEFKQWRQQIISYYTAEITADMYAEYIAIGCSQSIVFWWVGHPFYPALQLGTNVQSTELDMSRWRFNQVGLLAFQFIVEIFVDYVCVVLEMAAGIDFERIESLSTFLGILFMTMAALNINISSAIYLSQPSGPPDPKG